MKESSRNEISQLTPLNISFDGNEENNEVNIGSQDSIPVNSKIYVRKDENVLDEYLDGTGFIEISKSSMMENNRKNPPKLNWSLCTTN